MTTSLGFTNYGHLMTQKEVAEVLHLDDKTIARAEKSAILKLRRIVLRTGINEAEFLSYLRYSGL
jgi:hypothetical protein